MRARSQTWRRCVSCAALAALLATGWLAPAPARAQSDDVWRLTTHQLVDKRCASCHGVDGIGSDVHTPKLAGQSVAYLVRQLDAMRTGARASPIMSPIVSDLSDAQIIGLARYYARQPAKPDAVTNRALAAEGERVFFQAGRGIPPCAACHGGGGRGSPGTMRGKGMMGGMAMMGNMGPVPNLDGQHAAYIVSQLDAFAKGTRQSTVMGRIAYGLSEKARKAVAAYLSGLR